MKDRPLIRLGAMLGLAGAAIAVVANLLHPRVTGTGPTARFEAIAASSSWNLIHYLGGLSIFLLLAGFIAFARYLEGRPGHEWARLGLAAAVVGVGVGVVLIAIDGLALKLAVDEWAAAGRPTSGDVFVGATIIEHISTGLFNVFNGVLIGAAPIAAGIATIRSRVFPVWMGALAVIGGLGGLTVDLVQSLGGAENFLGNVVFPLSALLVTLWAIAAMLMILRGTQEEEVPAARAAVAS